MQYKVEYTLQRSLEDRKIIENNAGIVKSHIGEAKYAMVNIVIASTSPARTPVATAVSISKFEIGSA